MLFGKGLKGRFFFFFSLFHGILMKMIFVIVRAFKLFNPLQHNRSLVMSKMDILLETALTLYHTIPTFTLTTLWKKPFENIVGKGENAGNQHFLLFPQYFLPFPKQISILDSLFNCGLQMLLIWIGLKFCRLVKS